MTTFNRMGKYSQVIIVCIAGFGISATHADEIRLQTQSDFGQLDPAFWQSSADQTIIDAIFPKLIELLVFNCQMGFCVEHINKLMEIICLFPFLQLSRRKQFHNNFINPFTGHCKTNNASSYIVLFSPMEIWQDAIACDVRIFNKKN